MALAKAHAFHDGNKCTALVVMLSYLDMQGVSIQVDTGLDDLMVKLASSEIDYRELADVLKSLVL